MRQQERFLVSLLAEMRLKVKEGTQSTLVKMNEADEQYQYV
jgi:hypothetical protein